MLRMQVQQLLEALEMFADWSDLPPESAEQLAEQLAALRGELVDLEARFRAIARGELRGE